MAKKVDMFRLPKTIKKRQKNIDELSAATEDTIERHFFRRLANLARVKRFVIGWLFLMSILLLVGFLQLGFLRDKYQKLYFIPGGTFTEGMVGSYSNVNPIYASGSVDSSASQLIFSGLFAYDASQNLAPDLAESLTIDKTEKVYTVVLKQNLFWHDGKPLTAKDVVFTFKTIQKPDAQSPLLPSWQGIKIQSKDDRTVTFSLPSQLSSFPGSLTTGIIPEHLLKNVPADQLRSSNFNTISPIGTGPFRFDTVQVQLDDNTDNTRQQIGLAANDGYFKNKPGIKKYVINTYNSQKDLLKAYKDKKVNAISGLGEMKGDYEKDPQNNVYSIPVAGQTMVFFKNSEGILADARVRKALVLGANRQKLIESTGQILKPSDEPLLSTQLGYDKKFSQKTNNAHAAAGILDASGWELDPAKGIRVNKGRELRINLFALSNDEYHRVANELKTEWKQIGVDLNVSLQNESDLKNTVASHGYDALLRTISIPDPDVYPFWDSTQADVRSKSRLNFSEYKSRQADASLEAGRSRSNSKIRTAKYKAFLEVWNQDNPALALYQPNYTFIVRSPFSGFVNKSLVSPIDRYSDVNDWLIRQQRK